MTSPLFGLWICGLFSMLEKRVCASDKLVSASFSCPFECVVHVSAAEISCFYLHW